MRTHVVCFGSLVQGDDGFGVHVHRRLVEQPWPSESGAGAGEDVRLFDGSTLGLGALSLFDDCDRAIVVDALESRGAPGRVHRLRLEDLAPPLETFSAHAMDLSHLFYVLPIVFTGRAMPDVVIVGAEIELPSGTFSMSLSPPLVAAVEEAVAAIRAELEEGARRGR
jgi:hydrogenase maturation protease